MCAPERFLLGVLGKIILRIQKKKYSKGTDEIKSVYNEAS